MIKNKKGISLIVLIITIAVIIILASAVILSIANNRPIESAKEATEMHNNSVLLENAAVLSAQWKTDSLLGNTTMTRSEYVKQGLSSQGFTEEEIGNLAINEETGNVEKIGSAIEVAKNPTKFYGATITNYNANFSSIVGWKILYSDGNNIYLIADNYIPYENIPSSTKGHKPEQNTSGCVNGSRVVFFSNIVNDYDGSDSIKDSKIQKLNSKYFEYLKSHNTRSTNNNMKAVAYMLDTTAWKNFAGEDAEYAIGGPTSELLINSYNAKYPSQKIELDVEDINGYKYRIGSGAWDITFTFSGSDSLYKTEDSYSTAHSMWIASPVESDYTNGCFSSDIQPGDALNALRDSYMTWNLYKYNQASSSGNAGPGIRPVVCLKSGVVLEEDGNNGYKIK